MAAHVAREKKNTVIHTILSSCARHNLSMYTIWLLAHVLLGDPPECQSGELYKVLQKEQKSQFKRFQSFC